MAGGDNLLLNLKGRAGMLFGEEVKVRFTQRLGWIVQAKPFGMRFAHVCEAAMAILEVDMIR